MGDASGARGKALAIAAAVLAVAGTTALLLSGGAGDPPAPTEGGPRDPSAGGPGPRRLPARPIVAGERVAWLVEVDQDTDVDLALLRARAEGSAGPAEPDRQRFRVTIRGRLAVHGIPGEGQDLWISARLLDAQYRAGDREPAGAALLGHPFLARLDPRGALLEVRFHPDLPSMVRGACRSVLDPLAAPVPEGAGETWESEEEDLNGRVRVRSAALPAGPAGPVLERRRASYLRAAAGAPAVVDLPRLLRSRFVHRFREGERWPDSVEGEEEAEIAAGGRTAGRGVLRYAARRAPFPAEGAPPGTFAEALAALADPAVARAAGALADPEADAATARWTAADAAAAFARGFGGEYARARDLLLHWLRGDPARAAALARWLDGGGEGIGLDAELGLWRGIAIAGTPESQAALAAVLREPGWSDRSRMRAVAHASDAVSPTAEFVDALWEVHRGNRGVDTELGRTLCVSAAYAMGAAGGAGRASPEVRARAARVLADGLAAASDPAEESTLLDAAGNHGGPELLAAVEPKFASADPRVRAAAFRALRRMESPEAVAALLRHYREEKVAAVRAVAMESLAEMPPGDPSAAFARAHVLETREEACLVPLVRILGKGLSADAANEKALRALLARGPSAAVRAAVYEFVLPK